MGPSHAPRVARGLKHVPLFLSRRNEENGAGFKSLACVVQNLNVFGGRCYQLFLLVEKLSEKHESKDAMREALREQA